MVEKTGNGNPRPFDGVTARRLLALAAVLIVAALAGCGAAVPRLRSGTADAGGASALGGRRSPLILSRRSPLFFSRRVQRAFVRRWPLVLHQGGAYAVFPPERRLFEQTGLTLALTNHIERPGDGRTRYIDPRVANLEERFFGHYQCHSSTAPCPVDSADEQAFLAAVRHEIAKQHHNSSVVGYYVLDDYIGNIAGILEQVHAMVAADNLTLAHPRPTICGFGGSLDFQAADGSGHYEHDFASIGHFARQELLNFTRTACDMVDFYIYSFAHHAPVSDFSMQWTMPVMLAELRLRGWDPATTPVIGSPQAWEGVPPTAAQVAEQTAAFCAYGAQSIVAFTWRNFPPTGPQAEPELENSPEMRAGLEAGMQDCRRIWADDGGTVSRGARTVRVPPRIRPVPLASAVVPPR